MVPVTEIHSYRNNSTRMAIVTTVSDNPTLKYSQAEVRHRDHHAKQKHDRIVVDGSVCFLKGNGFR
jgi:hypothetical protein